MLEALIIFSREGFEAFLIVAIIMAYLRKTGQQQLASAVYAGIATAIIVSVSLGYLLMERGIDSLWEAALGVVAVVTVVSLVIHMWRTAPQLKQNMEKRLNEVSSGASRRAAFWGVFSLTVFMIAREGMESALMILQIRDTNYLTGIFLGLGIAAALAWAWAHFGHKINVKLFFRITGAYLLLFALQIAIYTFHEASEAGLLPNSDALHAATEPFSPVGIYGKWFSLVMIASCALWFMGLWIAEQVHQRRLKTQAG